ncbi:MAG: FG-GAP repeat protein, partial [Parasphingorhabdus sp.]
MTGLLMVPCVPAFASEPIEQHKILADDGAPEDFFGFNVAISGNTAIVGSYKADDEVKGVNTGSAYIFALSDGIW